MKKLRQYNQLKFWTFVTLYGASMGLVFAVLKISFDFLAPYLNAGVNGAFIGFTTVLIIGYFESWFLKK